MTDAVALAGFGFLGSIVTAVSAYAIARLNKIGKTGEKTHTLVNSNMGAQLKISALALREVATLRKTAESKTAAELAEKLLKEHEARQATVDSGEETS